MGTKVRKVTLSVVLAGAAAVLVAPPAEANRGNGTTTTTQPGYVPPYGQVQPNLPEEPNPYAPVAEPPVVPVELPAVVDPGAGQAGDGSPLGPVPTTDTVLSDTETRREAPAPSDGIFGGILSRTGAETLPLARAGLAAVALGLGLVVLARRRRADAASV